MAHFHCYSSDDKMVAFNHMADIFLFPIRNILTVFIVERLRQRRHQVDMIQNCSCDDEINHSRSILLQCSVFAIS
ncbi:hypothetical protein DERF_007818 [Dermatophagoides farinae]|uniref:Uncharacterized protein n=1 Tax=Dermatophagoides farinae TaxID=6954 RepID=A0A922L8H1_DERFA|nr:hypothetical protein DERF_007818 [Dermatophagoides farinae]